MTARPRVVLEALQVRKNPTGAGNAIGELTRALAAGERDLDFVVLAAHPEMFAELTGRPGWTVVDCPAARRGALRKAWFLERGVPGLVRELGGDLLHCPQFLGPGPTPVPVVTTVYDLAWLDLPGTVETARRAYYRWAVPRSLRASRLILAASEATAADVVRHFPALAARVRTTPLGTPSWVGEPRAVADRPEGPFLFVGTLEPRKNLVRLLEAYAQLVEERGGARVPDLVLAGPSGWRDRGIRSRLADLAPTGKVVQTGYCPRADLSAWYDSALALVFPSLHEGFGLPVLEAMARGVPVLTANRGALAEVAGSAALTVDPTDPGALLSALGRLLDEDGLRRDLAARGPARAREFSWDRTAELTVRAYREALAAPGAK